MKPKRYGKATPPAGGAVLRGPRAYALAAAVALVIIMILHPGPLFQGQVYSSSDTANANAFAMVGNRALSSEGYPLWNPFLFGGMPTYASMSYVRFVYFPGEAFSFLQDRLAFPPMTWAFGHLIFGALGIFWLLGRIGLPLPARILGLALWLCFPKMLAWTVHGHGSKLCATMYLPWITGAALGLLDGAGRRTAGLLAVLLGLQMLLGHVQITYYTLMVVGFLLLARWVDHLRLRSAVEPPPLRATGWIVGAALVALMIGSVLLLPVRDYAAWSVRGAGEGGGASYEYATGWSFSPRELDTLILPSASGFGKATYQGPMPFTDYPNYLGLLPIFLALFAFGPADRRLSTKFLIIAGLSLLLSFGNFFPPLFDLFYRYLPFFNKFRIPSMILTLVYFALAILAAIGAHRLSTAEAPNRSFSFWASAVMGMIGLVMILFGTGFFESAYQGHLGDLAVSSGRPAPMPAVQAAAWRLHKADLLRIGTILVLAAAVLLYTRTRPRLRRSGLVWMLGLLILVDLTAVGSRVTHPENSLRQMMRGRNGGAVLGRAPRLLGPYDRSAGDRSADPEYLELADRIGHDRIWPLGRVAMMNDGMTAGIRSLGGYHPAKPAAFETVRERLSSPDESSARLAAWMAGRLAWTGDRTLDIPGALPRARLVDAYVPADGSLEEFLDRVQDGEIDPAARVALDREPDPRPVAGDTPLPPVEYVFDGLNSVSLTASPDRPAILVLADNWLPGWTVQVDGRPAELLKADHMLRAVALPAGTHSVEFRYKAPLLRETLWLSAAGWLTALGLLLAGTLPALRWAGRRKRES